MTLAIHDSRMLGFSIESAHEATAFSVQSSMQTTALKGDRQSFESILDEQMSVMLPQAQIVPLPDANRSPFIDVPTGSLERLFLFNSLVSNLASSIESTSNETAERSSVTNSESAVIHEFLPASLRLGDPVANSGSVAEEPSTISIHAQVLRFDSAHADRHPTRLLESIYNQTSGRTEFERITIRLPDTASSVDDKAVDSLSDQIAAEVFRVFDSESKEISTTVHVQFNAGSLGEIRLQISLSNQAISLRIIASEPASARLIEQRLGELRKSLGRFNIVVRDSAVECESDATESSDSEDEFCGRRNRMRSPHFAYNLV
jgi:hypothetical protein